MQPLAITQGDSAGIGPEIVAKAFRDAPDALRGCFVVGDVATLRRAGQAIVRPGVPMVPVAQIASPADVLGVERNTGWLLIDPAVTWTVDGESLLSTGKNTPWFGQAMQGRVLRVFN